MAFHKLVSSTPVVSMKYNKKSPRKRWFEDEKNKPLFGKYLLDYRSEDNDNHNIWDDIESPGFFDFNDSSPESMADKFFDLKKEEDYPSPLRKEAMVLPTDADLFNLTDTLSACSISMIDNDTDDNTTIFTDDSAMNTTVIDRSRHSLGPKLVKKNNSSNCQRRLSTIPSPFSFELREESKHQLKQARQAHMAALEEEQRPIFKARPAPKIKPRVPLVAKKPEVTKSTCQLSNIKINLLNGQVQNNLMKENQALDQPTASPRQKSYVIASQLNPKIDKSVSSIPQVNKISVALKNGTEETKSTILPKVISKIQLPTTKIPIKSEKKIVPSAQKNEKQTSLGRPRNSTTKAKSPNLLTAKRAKQRQILEEQARQREIKRQEYDKKNAKELQLRAKEESVRLRKLTVHKARPLPKFINNQLTKRPLSNPTIPIDVKRRRID